MLQKLFEIRIRGLLLLCGLVAVPCLRAVAKPTDPVRGSASSPPTSGILGLDHHPAQTSRDGGQIHGPDGLLVVLNRRSRRDLRPTMSVREIAIAPHRSITSPVLSDTWRAPGAHPVAG